MAASASPPLFSVSSSPNCCGLLLRSSRGIRVRCSAERQALFSRIAPVYDNLNDVLSLGQHRVWKRMSVSWKRRKGIGFLICVVGVVTWHSFSPRKSAQMERCVLLISRGNNYRLLQLVKTCFGRLATKTLSEHPHNLKKNKRRWVEGDALNLPFTDCYFDAITMGYGLRNLIDKYKAMREIFRVLKPGSRMSILDFNKSTSPAISLIQDWMIDNVVVPVASSYGLEKEYKYLKDSIAEFLTGKELEKISQDAGFSNAKHYEIGGGLMGNLVASRLAA